MPRGGKLVAQTSPADRVMEVLRPEKIEKLGEGRYRIDFGEEISGWVHLHDVTGEAGQRIDIRYLCESPNGSNSYTMRGGAPESYHTRFTWYVFREVEIDGWPGELSPGQITAEAVYTDVPSTGRFECSNPCSTGSTAYGGAARRTTCTAVSPATVRTASGRPIPATGRWPA